MAGWLDNYGKAENPNDTKLSFPEGFVGDGYNTKGRNYSPAWGGQFEKGGEIPMAQQGKTIYVESKNDPRYRAYQDSLALYNFHKNPLNLPGTLYKQNKAKVVNKAKFIELNNKEGKLPYYDMNIEKFKKNKTSTNLKDFYKPGGIDGVSPSFVKDIDAKKREIINGVKGNDSFDYSKSPYYKMYTDGKYKMDKEYTQTDPKSYTQYEVDPITGVQGYLFHDFDNPSKKDIIRQVTLSSSKIKPQGVFYLGADNPITYAEMRMKKVSGKGPKNDQYVSNKTYSVGIEPYYKKPTTPVFVDENKYNPNDLRLLDLQKRLENTLLKKDINLPVNETVDIPVKRNKLTPIQNNLQPEGLVQSNMELNADVSGLRPQARIPKSYNVNSQRQNMSGSSDYYDYNQEGVDFETALRAAEAAEAYNQSIQTRYGNSKNPKAQERLKQLRQDLEVIPNYKNGGWLDSYNEDVPQAQDGIELSEYDIAMRGMMKSKIGMGNVFGNPAIKRMSQAMPKTGMTPEGIGTHYMGSMDNYAVPLLQDFGGEELTLVNPNTRSREAIRFNSPEEAEYFAEHYKEVAPMSTTYKDLNSFQMGGSIPGSVGFTYARTQGIPSEGPYAKKTMPSAQNGQEMRYYQEGLDFKPKGMKNGGWLDNISKAQDGFSERSEGLTKRDNIKTFKPIQEKDRFLTKAEKEAIRQAELAEKRGDIKKHTPQSKLSKAKEVTLNPLTAFGYIARNEDIPENFSRSEDTRNVLDNAIDFVNPAFYIESAKNLGENQVQVFNDLSQGNFGDAALSQTMAGVEALNFIPLAKGAKPLLNKGMQQLKNIPPSSIKTLPQAKNIREAIGTFAGIPTERSLPRLSPEELKIYRQAQEIGRMRSTGKPISEQYKYALEQGIPEEHLQQIFKKSKSEIESLIPDAVQTEAFRTANPIRDRINLQRPPRGSRQTNTEAPPTSLDDMYLEMPASLRARVEAIQSQVLNTSRNNQNFDDLFSQLDAGTHSSQRDDVIRNTLSDFDIDGITNQLNPIPEELILNVGYNRGRTLLPGQREGMSLLDSFYAKNTDLQRNIYNNLQSYKNKIITNTQDYPGYSGPVLENVPSLSLSSFGSLKGVSNKVTSQSTSGINSGDVFTGSLNTSHSSYLPQLKQVFKYREGSPQFLGYKPMNHMGFLSDFNYSADDIAKYLNTEIDEQIKRGIIPKNISRPYSTNKPNANYQSVNLPHYGIKQFQDGGVIKDDMGYWNPKNWGKPVEIDSNKITMKGVNQPLLGVSDTGDTQMMYPEEEYEFDGNKVIEYPLAKNGINNLDAKPLQKLNQLTNFTNYNTKQSGGWLDKYN
jgi:hypothetical protein